MKMELAQYLFNDDIDGFNKKYNELIKNKKGASDDASNINKENNRFTRNTKGNEEIEL